MQFSELGLSESLLRAVQEQEYDTPSPIQVQAIPAVLSRRDVMAAAQTGTGKTAGFTLPMLQLLSDGVAPQANCMRALILTPTRELAAQIYESVKTYGKFLPLKSTLVFGGVSINPQMMHMRKGVDVLVATPGRLLDLYQQNAVKFSQVQMLVLDEADRMLDMGFIHDIKRLMALMPKQRQTLLFSATFSGEIRKLAQGLLRDPVQIEVSPRNTTVALIEQSMYFVAQKQKAHLLSHMIRSNDWQQVLVFTRTKHGANRLAEKLVDDGIGAVAIHGNKSQGARTKALADFKSGAARVLVATDIAARGLDIEQLPHVVNYELPNVAEDYVHRIGRTGRAGFTGSAISLVDNEERGQLTAIEKLIRKNLTREEMPVLMASRISTGPERPRPPLPNRSRAPQRAGNSSGSRSESRSDPRAAQRSGSSSNQASREQRPSGEAAAKPRSTTAAKTDSHSAPKAPASKRRRPSTVRTSGTH